MTTRTLLATLFAILWGTCSAQARPKDFGKQWVRSHPFTTMGLALVQSAFEGETYQNANFSTTLAWKSRTNIFEGSVAQGLPWHFSIRRHPDGLSDEAKDKIKDLYSTYPGCTGWVVWDEPKRPEMFLAVPAIKWAKEQFPETLVYSNAYPRDVDLDRAYGPERPADWTYRDHLRDFITIMDSDILMFDLYPFREDGDTSNFFPCLEDTRAVALEYNVPYWAFIQSYADERRKSRMPSESDVRMQAFAHLAYGFTGIAYFTYDDAQGPGMVDMKGNPRSIYYHVQRLNMEIANVGKVLRFLTSTDVRYLPTKSVNLDHGPKGWTDDAGNALIKNVIIPDEKPCPWKTFLIGYFKDDDGKAYIMVTNLWHGKGASAADRQATITLEFDDSIKTVARLSRETGRAELLQLTDHSLTITLPGGTGDLFGLDGLHFPGLD